LTPARFSETRASPAGRLALITAAAMNPQFSLHLSQETKISDIGGLHFLRLYVEALGAVLNLQTDALFRTSSRIISDATLFEVEVKARRFVSNSQELPFLP
jgi:hypothetical protein